jgi:hypothetical protein
LFLPLKKLPKHVRLRTYQNIGILVQNAIQNDHILTAFCAMLLSNSNTFTIEPNSQESLLPFFAKRKVFSYKTSHYTLSTFDYWSICCVILISLLVVAMALKKTSPQQPHQQNCGKFAVVLTAFEGKLRQLPQQKTVLSPPPLLLIQGRQLPA